MIDSAQLERLLTRAEHVLGRLEAALPPAPPLTRLARGGCLPLAQIHRSRLAAGVSKPHPIRLADIETVDDQKARIVANTRQFVAGQGANNVLLTGARGCGKSSLVKAVLNEFRATACA
jgi:uncharacterized protein